MYTPCIGDKRASCKHSTRLWLKADLLFLIILNTKLRIECMCHLSLKLTPVCSADFTFHNILMIYVSLTFPRALIYDPVRMSL